jgi:methionine synthase II (cobalamin-independent)
MKTSTGRIHTSHAGSLPRPDDLIELNRARMAGDVDDEAAYQQKLRAAVMDVVARQRDLGIDIPGDGEYGKAIVVEHPELVAQRIVRFANLVGRENVIASTDCGLGGRVHPQIAWAKLETLTRGAELATRQLWR